ncbi:LcrG family type III secretion system chaperone [Vibrio sagamiensis]|uniref:Type III secretion protein LcrG n=1 Tax=Vibrio sagamiensis NBRC 104589 TaxID=1219064 RepID=A0A511QE52_9VIBR|nr:LcrG family type III secretion system chaperone [Vibrio sagamiensis]PNQ54565.1 type III secretion protein LcrG [Vibrio agarivorans]GEM75467.1 type III secretion protein LcrG [Vibrio sagamiensis NBRC 104589]
MQKPFSETIEQAKLTIKNAEERTDVFNQLLDGLGVAPIVGEILLADLNSTPQMMNKAEQELIDEVQRRREQQPSLQGALSSGTRRKRPTMMRGLVI